MSGLVNAPLRQAIDEEALIQWRRHLHMHPEISGAEKETSAYLAQELKAMGLKVKTNIAGYGLLATLEGNPEKKCVAMRADIDALPIEEGNAVDYCSVNRGCMHACGHDAHMTMALGVAKVMVQNPPGGTLKFVFQPREEKPPGGARDMLEAGVFTNPEVDVVLGQHVSPLYPAGTIALKNGTIFAVADDFHLTIKGRGGHGSSPHVTRDPIIVAAEAVVALQTIASRMNNPMEPLVITIGTIHGGTAQNIIPDRVEMTGTLRCLNNETRDIALTHMHEVLRGVTQAWGAQYQLNYLYGYPPVVNDVQITDIVRKVVRAKPELKLEEMKHSLLAGEDYAYYGQYAPSVYFLNGCGSEEKDYPWHHRLFDIDENCLKIGVEVMAETMYLLASEDK